MYSPDFNTRLVKFWTALAIILGVMPIWFTSKEMWDGIIGSYAFDSNNWKIIKNWSIDSNWYISYGLFLICDAIHQLTEIPYWVLFKFWITLLIFGIGYEAYKLAQSLFGIHRETAIWLPALIFSFPVWYVFFSYMSMIGHLTCVWLALVGYRYFYNVRRPIQIIGVIFIAASFQLASNCAFLIMIEFCRWFNREKYASWYFYKSLTILIVALLVFYLTRIAWPPVGTYIGYNKLLNPFVMENWRIYFQRIMFWATWAVLLLPLIPTIFKLYRKQQSSRSTTLQELSAQWKIYISFALLMIAVCAPYVAVGLASPFFVINLPSSTSLSAMLASNSTLFSVWYGGWGARHALLLMIVFVLFVGWTAQCLMATAKTGVKNSSISQLFAIIITFNLVFLIPGHFAKLTRIAQEQTIIEVLKVVPQAPYGQINFIMDNKIDYLVSSYEANYLLYQVYKATHWFAYIMPDHPGIKRWVEQNRSLIFDKAKESPVVIGEQNVMSDYNWNNRCMTVVRIHLPILQLKDILWVANFSPLNLPKASLYPISTNCKGADPFWKTSHHLESQ